MYHKVGIQDNKTSTLEEEYQLDPYQMGFDHVTPEPTGKGRKLVIVQRFLKAYFLSFDDFSWRVVGRKLQQDRSGLHW